MQKKFVSKKTLVIGGSEKRERYSNKAIRKLLDYGHQVESIGLRESKVESVDIITSKPDMKNIHTITMYIRPSIQLEYHKYLISLNPSRIIFNPGTENQELESIARDKGIEVVRNCTLIMLDYSLF